MRANGWSILVALLVAHAGLLACSSDSISPSPELDAGSGAGSGGQSSDGAPQDTAQGLPDTDAEASLPLDAPKDTSADAAAEPQEGAAEATAPDVGADGSSCVARAGLGQLSCTCNELDAPLHDAVSAYAFEDQIDFGSSGWDAAKLTAGGQQMVAEGNLNDGSLKSEIMAYEVLSRCDGAQLLKTEGKIVYADPAGKKTDLIVQVDGHKVGVSVARAYHYPPSNPYTQPEAQTLLSGKLSDMVLRAANATPQDAWERSILAIIAWDPQYADVVTSVWNQLSSAERANVILVVTVTGGNDAALY